MAADGSLPVLVIGPDAPAIMAVAFEQPLLLLAADAAAREEQVAEAVLAARLEGRRICLDGVERLTGGEQRRVIETIAARSERPLLCSPRRDRDTLARRSPRDARGDSATGPPERAAAWEEHTGATDVRDVAAKFRLSVSQIHDAARIARLAAAGRGDTRNLRTRPARRREGGIVQPLGRVGEPRAAGLRLERPGLPRTPARAAALDIRLSPTP